MWAKNSMADGISTKVRSILILSEIAKTKEISSNISEQHFPIE